MTRADIQAYSIRSHGMKIVRTHLYDWLTVIILLGIQIVLNRLHPFNRFVGKDMMVDLKYPFNPDNTIPFWSVHVFSVAFPVIIFLIRYIVRKDFHDLHHAILGLFYAYLITGVITDSIKNAVGRPRPNFWWRCFPDGQDFYDDLSNVLCYGDPKVVREGRKSFPSGHTSLSFAGLGFLSLYLAGKLQAFDRKGHICKLCVVFLPLLAAALVGVSRVDDYWHHWTDVFVGGLIGITISLFCYHQFFPSPHRTKGWGPYSYFIAIEREFETNGQNDTPTTEQIIISPHFSPARSREDHSVVIA